VGGDEGRGGQGDDRLERGDRWRRRCVGLAGVALKPGTEPEDEPDRERGRDQHRAVEDPKRPEQLEQDGESPDPEHRFREPRRGPVPAGQEAGAQPNRRKRRRDSHRGEPNDTEKVVPEAHPGRICRGQLAGSSSPFKAKT
jgi:hypothetical protein